MTIALTVLVLLAQQAEPKAKPKAPPPLAVHLESRMWAETRQGYDFGRQPDLNATLIRNRLSMEARPASWLKLSGMMQDTRAPNYDRPRPGSAQNPFDLHEAFLEVQPDAKTGWNVVAGRKRFFFGDQQVIGVPEWSNSGRTYDTAQVNYKWSASQLHVLMASIVRFDPNRFDVPNLHDRLTGAYFERNGLIDVYYFRHDRIQLTPTHTGGTRIQHRWTSVWKSTGEVMIQDAFGTVLSTTGHWSRVDSTFEYKYGSPGFDQLYPAGHNRLGHQDLFSLRNLHSVQWRNVAPIQRHTKLNFMYTVNWLADPTKPLYNLSSGVIRVSPLGTAGRMVGQEVAVYSTHQIGKFQLGLGLAQWFNGEFLQKTTPGKNTTYAYVHTTYAF